MNAQHQGLVALSRLSAALAEAHGEDAALLADGLAELADRTDAYLGRCDTPAVARIKCDCARANQEGATHAESNTRRHGDEDQSASSANGKAEEGRASRGGEEEAQVTTASKSVTPQTGNADQSGGALGAPPPGEERAADFVARSKASISISGQRS